MRRLLPTLALSLTLATAGTAAAQDPSSFEHAVLRQINGARRADGLAPLRRTRPLARVAQGHSRFLATRRALSHASADGSSFALRIHRVMRLHVAGETVAFGTTARRIVREWLASAPHRALLLDPRFRLLGVGARPGWFGGERVWYVTADLAN